MIRIVENIEIKIGNIDVRVPITIIELEYETFLLGLDWFRTYKVNLDVSQEKLTFEKDQKKYQVGLDKAKARKIHYITFNEEYLPEEANTEQMGNIYWFGHFSEVYEINCTGEEKAL